MATPKKNDSLLSYKSRQLAEQRYGKNYSMEDLASCQAELARKHPEWMRQLAQVDNLVAMRRGGIIATNGEQRTRFVADVGDEQEPGKNGEENGPDPVKPADESYEDCSKCNGTKLVDGKMCKHCGGSGIEPAPDEPAPKEKSSARRQPPVAIRRDPPPLISRGQVNQMTADEKASANIHLLSMAALNRYGMQLFGDPQTKAEIARRQRLGPVTSKSPWRLRQYPSDVGE